MIETVDPFWVYWIAGKGRPGTRPLNKDPYGVTIVTSFPILHGSN
jgi:hypothetical protein